MKKATNLFIGILCTILAVILVLLSFQIVGDTSSSYLTTATQYGVVETITPYKLNNEVKISFASEEGTENDTIYIESTYSSQNNNSYLMRIENVSNATDYFEDEITASNASDFVDYYGVTKASNNYGTLTDTANSISYDEPLHTEWTVGSLNASATSLNLASFTTAVTVTVYAAVSSTYATKTLFDFNGTEISYVSESNKTDGVYYYPSGVANNYSYTVGAGSADAANYELYTYTTVVGKETAVNIQTATNSQTEIFLIVLSPITGVSVADSSGYTSSYVSVSVSSFSLTASYDTLPATVGSVSGSWSSSDSSIAEVDSNGNVTAKSAGIAQITYSIGGAISVYSVYVRGLYLSGGKKTIGVGRTTQLTATYIGAIDLSDTITDVTSNGSTTWSTSSQSYATVSAGLITGVAVGSATITATYNGSSATFDVTVKSIGVTNITNLVGSTLTVSDSSSSSSTDLYSDDYTTVTAMKGYKVSSNSKSIDDYTFSYRLQLNGKKNNSYEHCIKIVAKAACYVKVYAISGSSDDERDLILYSSSGSALQSFTTTGSIASYTYDIDDVDSTSGTTYYIGSNDGGINIYCIEIMYKDSISVSGDSSIYVGATTTLTATVNSETSTNVTWSSSDTSIATVDSNGVVTGISAGTATITATYTSGDESVSASLEITVNSAGSLTMVQSSADPTVVTSGTYTVGTGNQTATISVTNSTDSGQTYTVTATTSDSSIVTVNSVTAANANGISLASEEGAVTGSITLSTGSTGTLALSLTPKGVGTATITITITNSAGLTVATTSYPVTIQNVLAISGDTSVELSESTDLSVATTDSSCEISGNVTWSSSDKSIATVDSDGKVTANSSTTGTVTITAKANVSINSADAVEYTATYTIKVVEPTTSYTATYTINSDASSTKDTSAFDVAYTGTADADSSITVSGAGGNGITYKSDSSTYSAYDGYSEFKTSRYAIITSESNVTITSITVYASTSTSSRVLYITTTAPSDTTGKIVSSTGNTSAFTLTADNLETAGQTYYVWASDTIKVYAIVIEYDVAATTSGNNNAANTATVVSYTAPEALPTKYY